MKGLSHHPNANDFQGEIQKTDHNPNDTHDRNDQCLGGAEGQRRNGGAALPAWDGRRSDVGSNRIQAALRPKTMVFVPKKKVFSLVQPSPTQFIHWHIWHKWFPTRPPWRPSGLSALLEQKWDGSGLDGVRIERSLRHD